MVQAQGVRITWDQLPRPVRAMVEDVLEAEVVEAVSQTGGFSPGSADRVRAANGRRAFVKAVSAAHNAESPHLHRREIAITAALPVHAPTPRLLAAYDHDDWVALILEDVDGRHPHTPWRAEELQQVMHAAATLAADLTPSPLPDVPSAADNLRADFEGWTNLRADPWADLDPWAVEHLDDLCRLAALGHAALTGTTLVHTDVRADNLLLRPDGSVVFVDWPWACTGPAWLDRLLVLINVAFYGGHDTEALARETLAGLDPEQLTGVLVGFAGFFLDASRRPDPPGLPTVRAFQRAQGVSTLAWARRRIGSAER